MAKVKGISILEILILFFFITYLLLPILAIIIFSISDTWGVGDPLPRSFTLKWYINSFMNKDLLISIGRSMFISFISVIIGLIIILPTAYIVRCNLRSLEPLVRFFTLFPYVLPGVILALGLIQIYSKPPFPIAGTIYILLFAYIAISLPFMYFVISNSLQSIDVKTLTEASQSLGAGMIDTFFRVIIPNITPGIINASLLTFAGLLGEYTLVNLLLGARFKTLQVYLYTAMNTEGHTASVLTVVYFIMVSIVSFVVIRVVRGIIGEKKEIPVLK